MPPFSTNPPWFTLTQRKKKPRTPGVTPPENRYRKRKDMVSAPQPSSLPLLFATESIGRAKAKHRGSGSPDPQSIQLQHYQYQHTASPLSTPNQTPNKPTATKTPIVNGKSYGALIGGRGRRKPVLKVNTDQTEWRPPQSPFDARPPSSASSPASGSVSASASFVLIEPQRRCSPPARLSPRSRRSPPGSRAHSPPPPRPQRRIVSAGAGPPSYVPPPSTFSALGPRPISAFPTSSRPAGYPTGRPNSLPADTSDIYNFFLGNNVTRKRVDFHEISPRDMRDLASDVKNNKRAYVGNMGGQVEHKRKSVKPRGVPIGPPKQPQPQQMHHVVSQAIPLAVHKAMDVPPRQASSSPSSVDKVWFASTAPVSKCA